MDIEMSAYPASDHKSVGVQRKKQNAYRTQFASLSFCLIFLVLLAVATATDYWSEFTKYPKVQHSGLWKTCTYNEITKERTCLFVMDYINKDNVVTYIVAIVLMALPIASLLFGFISFLLLCLALCKKAPQGTSIGAGVTLIFSSIFVSAIIGVYVAVKYLSGPSGDLKLGYSFMLAGAADGLAFVAAILAYVGGCLHKGGNKGVVIASAPPY